MRVPEISMVVDNDKQTNKQTNDRLHERGHHIVPDFSVGDKNCERIGRSKLYL